MNVEDKYSHPHEEKAHWLPILNGRPVNSMHTNTQVDKCYEHMFGPCSVNKQQSLNHIYTPEIQKLYATNQVHCALITIMGSRVALHQVV